VQILSGRRDEVEELAFSHCGRWLAAAGYTGGLHVWDTADPTAPPQHPKDPDSVCAGPLVFRADGRALVKDESHWFLYDPTSQVLTTICRSQQLGLVPSPDGRRFIRTYGAPPLRTYTFGPDDKLVPEAVVRDKKVRYFWAIAFAPDGATFAISEERIGSGAPSGLTLRAAETAKPIRELKSAFGHTYQMAFSNDGAYLIARSAARLACWTLAEPDAAPRLVTNSSRKHFVATAVHPDGPLLTVDNDRLVRVWTVPALTTHRSITWNIGKLLAVAVSPDGTRAAVGSATGKVLVWDWD
jgi:WD40 repeat protein